MSVPSQPDGKEQFSKQKDQKMNDLIAVQKIAQWQKLKALVLDSVSSPITKRMYSMALNEFMGWFQQAPDPASQRQPLASGVYRLKTAVWVRRQSSPAATGGVKTIQLPAKSPNPNAFAER